MMKVLLLLFLVFGFLSFSFAGDQEYRTARNPLDQDVLALAIANYFGSASEVNDYVTLDEFLESNGLNNPHNREVRQNVFNRVAIQLAQAESLFSFRGGDIVVEVRHTGRLSKLKNFFNERGIEIPPGFKKAEELERISLDFKDDHKGFLEAVSERFRGKELTQIVIDSNTAYAVEDRDALELIRTMAKGEIDQDFLYDLVVTQISSQSLFQPYDTHDLYVPGLLEEALKHFDIDHVNHLGGSLGDSLICVLADQVHSIATSPDSVYFDEENNKLMALSLVEDIERVFGYGANINQECKDGRTPLEKLRVAHMRNLLDITDYAFFQSNMVSECNSIVTRRYAPELCLTVDIVGELTRSLGRSVSTSEKGKGARQVKVFGTSNEYCDFLLIEKKMSQNGLIPSKEVALHISHRSEDKYILTAKSKKELLAKLQILIEKEKVVRNAKKKQTGKEEVR